MYRIEFLYHTLYSLSTTYSNCSYSLVYAVNKRGRVDITSQGLPSFTKVGTQSQNFSLSPSPPLGETALPIKNKNTYTFVPPHIGGTLCSFFYSQNYGII